MGYQGYQYQVLIIIMADDKEIRQRYQKRDKDFNEKIKEEMQ
jgi:hypothetical protein